MKKEEKGARHSLALVGAVLASAGLLAFEISDRAEFSFLQLAFLLVGAAFLAPQILRSLNLLFGGTAELFDRHLVEHPGKAEAEAEARAKQSERPS